MNKVSSFLLKAIGIITLIVIIILSATFLLAGFWLKADDEPRPVDAIVVLAGDFGRAFYAADLYNKDIAPVVYLSRPILNREQRLLRDEGIDYPRQEDIMRQILLKKGVPGSAIRFFGVANTSTRDEAETLSRVFAKPVRVLIVTSPYHVRRTKIIFKRAMPGHEILVTGTPYDPFPTAWWSQRDSAQAVILEMSKIVFYLLGGDFDSGQTDSPAPPPIPPAN